MCICYNNIIQSYKCMGGGACAFRGQRTILGPQEPFILFLRHVLSLAWAQQAARLVSHWAPVSTSHWPQHWGSKCASPSLPPASSFKVLQKRKKSYHLQEHERGNVVLTWQYQAQKSNTLLLTCGWDLKHPDSCKQSEDRRLQRIAVPVQCVKTLEFGGVM